MKIISHPRVLLSHLVTVRPLRQGLPCMTGSHGGGASVEVFPQRADRSAGLRLPRLRPNRNLIKTPRRLSCCFAHLPSSSLHPTHKLSHLSILSSTMSSFQKEADDEKCINTIRTLAADVVAKSNSGHPGEFKRPTATTPRALC